MPRILVYGQYDSERNYTFTAMQDCERWKKGDVVLRLERLSDEVPIRVIVIDEDGGKPAWFLLRRVSDGRLILINILKDVLDGRSAREIDEVLADSAGAVLDDGVWGTLALSRGSAERGAFLPMKPPKDEVDRALDRMSAGRKVRACRDTLTGEVLRCGGRSCEHFAERGKMGRFYVVTDGDVVVTKEPALVGTTNIPGHVDCEDAPGECVVENATYAISVRVELNRRSMHHYHRILHVLITPEADLGAVARALLEINNPIRVYQYRPDEAAQLVLA